jgi:hypothetical protein
VDSVRVQLTRQVAHWSRAAGRLEALENLAAPGAWAELERYLGVAVRDSLRKPIERLQRQAIALRAALDAARTAGELERVRRHLVDFRKRYLRTETMVAVFADAVNTRTNPELAAVLRSCDELARRSLVELLDQLGRPAPPVLTYIDKGLGASILKAGLRLWDGSTENPAAAIKIVHHNMQRPTALIHEAGHQMAHILGWNEELAAALEGGLGSASPELAKMWASWSSEIAADAFAFVHTGYASVAGLHDVLAGDDAFVFRYTEFDPHPISYIRVLLGVEMCRQFYGPGPWDDLALAWQHSYPLAKAEAEVRTSLSRSILLLGQVVALTLQKPAQAFKGRALTELIDPQRVGPQALQRLERQIGPALYTSPHWVWAEPLRLLALTGYRAATRPEQAGQAMVQQEQWMKKLGRALKAA